MRSSAVLVFVAFALVLVGCTSTPEYRPEEIKAAINTSKVFFDQLSARQYDAICMLATPELRAPDNRDRLVAVLKTVNEKAGSCSSPILLLTTAGRDKTGRFVDLRYKRTCAIGEVQELLSWSTKSGKPLLRSYFASNPALAHERTQ